ncbi:hypothetical protein HCN44_005403 [Aphidius gifuensis]|uniref:Methyltransferase type 11 domain-containing protein n=1 Tax=Aphidius gifuensis TaxID=684658 RepID=A0A834Y615_APHGI|nr:M-phase inducer phosphatase [Aphidius gifuensis]KAF7997126.1 hypothetical protein HCN44_005403 [Aphidius gifuensis]
MSVSHGEHAARSVALEQAYVHEVYEQCAEKTAQTRHWPSVYKFLEELEPGALVCDIGCGDGKYLNANKNIFNVGGDRCKRLTDIAREKEKEVLVCDNLSLPFRDESFDAVLSIAVVHHFATTERRVNALKELARVLRIGGKLVISVWAMEQRHRKFESQDVLVPWPKSYCLNSGMKPCMKKLRQNSSKKGCILKTKKSKYEKNNCNNKNHWNEQIFSPSPSTSSLSSPNETCYSFFRRALQKLAGGKRNSNNQPWFRESFNSSGIGGFSSSSSSGYDDKNIHHYHDCGDIDDIPIELRRLEDDNIIINKQNETFNIKSKSLGDILEIQRSNLVRSRSSIPGLCSTVGSNFNINEESMTTTTTTTTSPQPPSSRPVSPTQPPLLFTAYKPRLVKQKTHLIDDTCLEIPEDTAIRELIKDLPEFPTNIHQSLSGKRGNIHKQSSMNEEFMSMGRIAEREYVRKNIMKQASLNEEIICKHSTFETFKDSISSVNATRKFKLLKNGLTKRLQQSTMSMEKVSGMSIKNGFVKILQGWKSNDSENDCVDNDDNDEDEDDDNKTTELLKNEKNIKIIYKKDTNEITERRLSKEDGSDSSKDSSLQSDTSVDSEDSFASVIYVPKREIPPLIDVPSGYQLRTTSAPPSPRIKHPPDLHTQRIKMISISPLLKQFPATSKSLPPPSPPGLSPKTINLYNSRPFFGPNYQKNQHINYTFDKPSIKTNEINLQKNFINNDKIVNVDNTKNKYFNIQNDDIKKSNNDKLHDNVLIDNTKKSNITIDEDNVTTVPNDISPLIMTNKIQDFTSNESIIIDDSRKSRLKQIKELLKQKPGFATRCTKSSFPLVRRASTATAGKLETVTRTLPRLLSLELFNPETDDLDSDSSGVSSPESAGSVISVISDERYILNKKLSMIKVTDNTDNLTTSTTSTMTTTTTTNNIVDDKVNCQTKISSQVSSQSLRLLEAAANVASSLEDAVSHVIKSNTQNEKKEIINEPVDIDIIKTLTNEKIEQVKNYLKETDRISPNDEKWNDECHQHLINFTEKLSENLINDIDKYCQEKKQQFNNDILIEKNNNTQKILSSYKNDCKYTQLVDNTIAWLKNSTGDNDFSEYNNKLIPMENGIENDDDDDNDNDKLDIKNTSIDKSYLKLGESIESSDIGDSIDNTISISDESTNNKKLSNDSTASLVSSNNSKDKRKYNYSKKSISEDITNEKYNNISSSSSQESLNSERDDSGDGDGAITYHQYYHVFREGELDQLINKYVENLHIISSYYDHASWCIVAEKVQVWTI